MQGCSAVSEWQIEGWKCSENRRSSTFFLMESQTPHADGVCDGRNAVARFNPPGRRHEEGRLEGNCLTTNRGGTGGHGCVLGRDRVRNQRGTTLMILPRSAARFSLAIPTNFLGSDKSLEGRAGAKYRFRQSRGVHTEFGSGLVPHSFPLCSNSQLNHPCTPRDHVPTR